MSGYENYSKEELIRKIEELEQQIKRQKINNPSTSQEYKEAHSVEVLDALPDMLSVFDKEYNYVSLISSEATVHVGGSGENLRGKNLVEILPPDAYIPVKANFDKVVATGKASISFHNLCVDGEQEHFENRVIPLSDNKHILCICRNITARVKMQNQLEMVTSAVNNSLEDIYAVKIDGTIEFANKQFINQYKLTGDIRSYKIFNVLPEMSQQSWSDYVKQIRNNETPNKHTFLNFKINGKEYSQELSAFILKDSMGQEIVWTIGRDITYRIEQEKQINSLNKLMETILNNIPVYLFVKDTGNEFRYLYWNKEFANASGILAEAVIGKTDREIFPHAEDAEKFRRDDLEILKNDHTVDYEEDYTNVDGEKRIVHTIKTLVPLEGEQPLLIGICWDITQQKKTEQELIQARIKAEEADKLKSAFLANMSHEIRTPLNAIVGFSKLMAEDIGNDERQEYAEIIDKNTELLLQLINDILDLSKIEAGMLKFEERSASLNELCQSIYGTFLPRIPKGVEFIYDKNPEDTIIFTDNNRVAQVLSNLLNNARKFTQSGEIRFGYKCEKQQVQFYVRDTGMGIAPENIDKIFNRFIKLNSFIQGTGLGLPICQMIIENLGGKIEVTSTLNQGTEFRFTLPWKPAELKIKPRTPRTIGRKNLHEITILIAEDVDSNYLLLESILGKNYHLIHAWNGEEAVEMYQKKSPDLILMDIKMPGMDGLEATRIIRQQSQTIPIIALTAFAYESDKENAQRAGCDDFLVKPISVALLNKTLKKYI